MAGDAGIAARLDPAPGAVPDVRAADQRRVRLQPGPDLRVRPSAAARRAGHLDQRPRRAGLGGAAPPTPYPGHARAIADSERYGRTGLQPGAGAAPPGAGTLRARDDRG